MSEQVQEPDPTQPDATPAPEEEQTNGEPTPDNGEPEPAENGEPEEE